MSGDMNSSALCDYWDKANDFDDPFLARLAESVAVTRLKDIGFLGAIDYVRFGNEKQNDRQYFNRYEHSLGVAFLALTYSKAKNLSEYDSRVLASAGLLHDIGHGPLSHTLEPIFKKKFGVSHHGLGRDILYGKSVLGSEIAEIFLDYKVDVNEVVEMIEGKHEGSHAFLFSSPINVDTLDGICRAMKFADVSGDCRHLDPRRYVAALVKNDENSTEILDEFWNIKHEVYNKIIYSCVGLLFDGLAQAYMHHKIDKFSVEDFYTTERALQLSHPDLFEILESANESFETALDFINATMPELLDYSHTAPTREFHVEHEISFQSPADLFVRYLQTKAFRDVKIGELLSEELN